MSWSSVSEFFVDLLIRIFLILPVPLLAFFILSLVLFLTAPKGSDKRRKRKIWFIVITVICAVLFLIWLAIVAFFVLALSHM